MEYSIKDILQALRRYQAQMCGNFSDLNDDNDDIRGHLLKIEAEIEAIKTMISKL